MSETNIVALHDQIPQHRFGGKTLPLFPPRARGVKNNTPRDDEEEEKENETNEREHISLFERRLTYFLRAHVRCDLIL